MRLLLSFICLSFSLTVLVGCGDKTEEIEGTTQPAVEDATQPAGEENAFEQLFEEEGDTVVVRPAVPTGDNAFEDLFGDKEETVPTKKPSIPVLPIADPVADPIAEPVVEPADGEANAFEDLFNE